MELERILVKKNDSTLQEYDAEKIAIAINKSANAIASTLCDDEVSEVIALVEARLLQLSDNVINVNTLHSMVIVALQEVRSDVAESYRNYRNWRMKEHEEAEELYREYQKIQFLGDKSNSNADSCLTSTKRVKKLDAAMKKQYMKYHLTPKERQAVRDGYIYVHDISARADTMNCCLFDVSRVLTGGFEMGNIWYNEPKDIDVCFDVIGDIVLMAASQQYGGFTVPEVEKILEPYAEKSYQRYLNKYLKKGLSKEMAEESAYEDTLEDIKQGYQGWEYKFNTVASSRGDYPFVTISFGLSTSKWGKEINKIICDTRRNGQGKKGFKKPVLFPKLVFLYDEELHGPGKELEDVFNVAVKCSSKTMYPDFLSMSGEGYIASMYKRYGKVISPMGCRAFLSPWYERGGMYLADDNDTPIFVGRFNIGVVSLNLPMILQKSRSEDKDFYEVLDYYLQMIRQIHCKTYDYLAQMRASMNPLGFCEGGFYGGNLKLDDKIEPLLKSATASFGITALNELQMLYNGKSLVDDGQFALEVMEYINNKVQEYKAEDGRLYAIYGSPAESLCGTQVTQFRKAYGIVKGVSDREYVSNSFHCHVTENITPIEKQDLEKRFWELFNGGKIQYVRYPVSYNIEAIKTLVRRAMEMGFYEGINLSLAYCDDCGHQELEMDVCPKCGSRNLTKIDRMNGYLSYSRVHGDTRLNAAKMAEIAERKSM